MSTEDPRVSGKGNIIPVGIPVPRGRVARTGEEAERIAEEIGGKVIVKVQVHAGGWGRAGGIKTATSPNEAREIAEGLPKKKLVTHQTGPQEVPVNSVLVEEAAVDAIFEAADARLSPIICITEGIPPADMMVVRHYLVKRKYLPHRA